MQWMEGKANGSEVVHNGVEGGVSTDDPVMKTGGGSTSDLIDSRGTSSNPLYFGWALGGGSNTQPI